MSSFADKVKAGLSFFLIFLFFFFWYGSSVPVHAKNYLVWNFLFDADTYRVVRVFTERDFASIDVPKHPLYVLLYKPLGRWLNSLIGDPRLSTLTIVVLLSAVGIALAYLIFRKLLGTRTDGLLFTVILACSASFWLLSSMTETPGINAAIVIIAFYLQGFNGQSRRRWIRALLHYLFSIFATGTTLTNSFYCVLGYANSLRRRQVTIGKTVLFTAVFAAVTLLIVLQLSSFQHTLYTGAFQFGSPADFATTPFKEDYFYSDPGELFDKTRVIVLLRTMLIDTIVAPQVVLGYVEAYDMRWNMLTFSDAINLRYGSVLLVYLCLCLAALKVTVSQKLYQNIDFQLAAAYISFNSIVFFFFRTVGRPFLFSPMNSFCIIYIIALAYSNMEWRYKRAVLFLFAVLLVVNNFLFIRDLNYLLATASPADYEYLK